MEALELAPVTYQTPDHLRVKPPAPGEGRAGWIATRSLDVYGRPVAFAFATEPPQPEGRQLFLDEALVKGSANYRQLVTGAAYPLFYDPSSPMCAPR
jgi:hypothetical protein